MEKYQLDHKSHKPSEVKYPLCLLVDNMHSPMNVGSVFLIADALGIESIYLSGNTVAPPNSKIRKTSRSCEKYVPFKIYENTMELIELLRNVGYKIVSLELARNSIELEQLTVNKDDKICLILGSENNGVNEQVLGISDEVVHIPMLGVNSSMNVASACSIAAYEIIRKLKVLGVNQGLRSQNPFPF